MYFVYSDGKKIKETPFFGEAIFYIKQNRGALKDCVLSRWEYPRGIEKIIWSESKP